MIRIDLGRDGFGNREGGGGKTGFFDRLPIPKGWKRPSGPGLSAGNLTAVGIAAIIAILPQPFLKRYKLGTVQTHQRRMEELRAEIKAYEREVANLTPYQSELQSYEAQKQAVSNRLVVVQNLLTVRKTPVAVLDALGQNLSRRTWLKEIDVKFSGAETVRITGQSYANEEISDYVDKLSESVYLTEVALANMATTKGTDNLDFRTFEISARARTGQGK